MFAVLAHIRPLDLRTNTRVDVRVASSPGSAYQGLGGYVWESAITRRPRASLELFALDLSPGTRTASADFEISLNGIKEVDPSSLYWVGAPVIIYRADKLAWPATVEFEGVVADPKPNLATGRLSLACQVSTASLEKPLLTKTFEDTTLTYDADKRTTLLPAGFGVNPNVEPVLFDSVRNMYMLDGYGNLTGVSWLGEGLATMGPSVANYATQAALAAALDAGTVPPGRWATCYAEGIIATGAPPIGVLTCHATFGYGMPGALLRRILTSHAGILLARLEDSSFTALDTAVPRPIHYWFGDQRQVKDVWEATAAACNASPIVTFQNKFAVVRPFGGASIGTFKRFGFNEPAVKDWQANDPIKPYWKLAARSARPGRVLATQEVMYEDDLRDRGLFDDTVVYRRGDIVWLENKSQWLYINEIAAAGHIPPDGTAGDTWWQNMAPGVEGASVPAFVLAAATNFNADNDRNNLVPPIATSIAISSSMALDGSATLLGAWAYTTSATPTAANNIDGFFVGFYPQATNASFTYSGSGSTAIVWQTLEAHVRTATLLGQPVEKYYWLIVIPYRRVGTDIIATGVITGPAAQNAAASGHRPAATPNYQGNLSGQAASYIANTVNNINLDNDGNYNTPPAATGLFMSSVTYADSTAGISGGWAYTHSFAAGAANNIDGFLVGLASRASNSGFTYTGGSQDNVIHWQWVKPHVRGAFWSKPANRFQWLIVIPVRIVRADIASEGYIEGPAAQTASGSPHQPSPTINFTGSIASQLAASVASGGVRALSALDASGNVLPNKVSEDAIIAGAISESNYAASGGLYAFAVSDSNLAYEISGQDVDAGGRLKCTFVVTHRIEKTGPVLNATYSLQYEIVLQRISTGTLYVSNRYKADERWDAPTVAGAQTLEQRTNIVEHYFSGLPAGAYNVGWRCLTPPTNGCTLPAYRYLAARNPRADE